MGRPHTTLTRTKRKFAQLIDIFWLKLKKKTRCDRIGSPIPFGQRTRTLLEFLISPRITKLSIVSGELAKNSWWTLIYTYISKLVYLPPHIIYQFHFQRTGDRQLRRHRAAKDVAKVGWLAASSGSHKVADIPVPRPCPIIMLEREWEQPDTLTARPQPPTPDTGSYMGRNHYN